MAELSEIERLRAENERLRRVIGLLASPSDAKDKDKNAEDVVVDAPDAAGPPDSEDTGSEDGVETTPNAIWDKDDRVYRCAKCCGEIDEGICSWCLQEHVIEEEDDYDSLPTLDNQAFSEDRILPPRGTTPLLDLPKEGISVPLSYTHGPPGPNNIPKNRSDEYFQLIRRGATRAMCEEFSLEFTAEEGIVAWMNQDIMDEFAGPAMDEGDQWKIYLGRRVKLDADDPDGTLFIEGILEDGILCHPKLWDRPRWVTVKECAKIWATRPNPDIDNPLDLNHDWYINAKGVSDFCLVDPLTGARTEIPESQDHENPDSDEEDNRQPQAPTLQNVYDSEDDGDEAGSDVKLEEQEDTTRLAVVDPTLDLGIEMEDGDDDDMEWEKQSTDPSSCDSDFYTSD